MRPVAGKEGIMLDAFKINGSSPPVDITVQNEGSIFILTGRTDAGREWIEENCQDGDYNPFGYGARLVEHRYIGDIVSAAIGDGLAVR
jgi:hypothetical protein